MIEPLDIKGYQLNYIVFTFINNNAHMKWQNYLKKVDTLLEKVTLMKTNILSLPTEINNVKEDNTTNAEKIKKLLRIHTELINERLKITDSKVEDLEASIKFMSEKFE